MASLPADEDDFDEADWLADDDALVLGVADVVAEGDEDAVCVGASLVQVELGDGLIVPSDVGLGLGVTLGVGVPLGVSVGLAVLLGLLVLALGEALALELVVLPPLWFPLEDVAGAVVFSVVLLVEPVVVGESDGCADDDGQELGVL